MKTSDNFKTPKFWNGYREDDLIAANDTNDPDMYKITYAYYRKFNDGDKPNWCSMKFLAKKYGIEFDHWRDAEFMDTLMEKILDTVLR